MSVFAKACFCKVVMCEEGVSLLRSALRCPHSTGVVHDLLLTSQETLYLF